MKNTHSSSKRLESLDALRGFDLFFLVALGPLMHSLARTANVEWLNESMWVFSHVSWEGFSPWDLIMPLFLFMSGISMPFSLSRYKSISDKRPLLRRLAKRILLLWIFGMMCQGNLLALDPNTIYLIRILYKPLLPVILLRHCFSFSQAAEHKLSLRWCYCWYIGQPCSSLR